MQGWKVGLLGVVEEEWIATLATIDSQDVEYVSFQEEARRLANALREQGADIVVALTHSRVPNDVLLCETVPEIDILLGGHDHHYEARRIDPHGTWMVKAGTEFRYAAEVSVSKGEDGSLDINVVKHEVTQMTSHVCASHHESGDCDPWQWRMRHPATACVGATAQARSAVHR